MSDYRGIGVLGGSFNPVHKGHVFLAEYVRETCRLEKVLMIPTGVHPFSTKRKNVPPGIHRLNMIKLAIEDAPGVEASDIEIRKEEPSYTYITLTELREQYGEETPIHFIVGTDELMTLNKWYCADRIVQEFGLIVGIRPHFEKDRIMEKVREMEEEHSAKILLVDLPAPDVSSTQVREALMKGEDTSGLISEKVLAYIRVNGLYKPEEVT